MSNTSTIRVVYIVIDTRRLTLYHEDGQTTIIPQGDSRVPRIIEDAVPVINAGQVAIVDLEVGSAYKDFEEKSGGIVKFFRVAKQKLKNLFADPVEPIMPGEFGVKPVTQEERVAEVMAHAVPVNGANPDDNNTHTIIATVDNKVIPGVEKMHSHVAHSAKMGSTAGLEKFFQRLAAVINERSHTVQELLRFMERGDLPVADDGSIIAYKLLNERGGGVFVDPHSGKVMQRVGSFVCMDESLIDHDRRLECSTGLHIARRGYLGGFSGTDCFLIKVAPEDVIAVPNYDANKMRARGYHIIAHLSPEMMRQVKSNQPMTNTQQGKELLAKAITGKHIGIIEEVRVSAALGGKVVTTPLDAGLAVPAPLPAEKISKAIAVEAVGAQERAEHVDPKKLVSVPEPAPVEAAAPVRAGKLTKVEEARRLYNRGEISQLKAFKHASKKSWQTLGFTDAEAQDINSSVGTIDAPNQEQETSMPAATPASAKPMSRLEQGTMLVGVLMEIGSNLQERTQAAVALKQLKKTSKVGWPLLGVDAKAEAMITDMLKDQPTPIRASKKTKALSARLKGK